MLTLKRTSFALFIAVLALLTALPVAAQDGENPRTGFRYDAPAYAIRGPHPVGYMTFSPVKKPVR
jgi:hypothetical protein